MFTKNELDVILDALSEQSTSYCELSNESSVPDDDKKRFSMYYDLLPGIKEKILNLSKQDLDNNRWCHTCENNNELMNYNCKLCIKGIQPKMYDKIEEKSDE